MAIREFKTQSREEWLALRHKYIGGSDAAAVVGLNPFCSAYALWAEKTGRAEPFAGNLATEVGTWLEDFVARKFEAETGKRVRRNNRSLVNDLYPWAIANIDREVVGEDAGLEIKTTSELSLKSFKNGDYPGRFYAQCLHYLAVTGKKKWYLAVLIGNRDFRIYEIERDDEEIRLLMDAEKEFHGLITADTPPAPDGSPSSTSALTQLYGSKTADLPEVDLSDVRSALLGYASVSAKIGALTKEKDEYSNIIKARLGEATDGKTDGFSVSWRPTTRKSFDEKAFRADHPEIELGKYYKQTVSRTFRLTEKED